MKTPSSWSCVSAEVFSVKYPPTMFAIRSEGRNSSRIGTKKVLLLFFSLRRVDATIASSLTSFDNQSGVYPKGASSTLAAIWNAVLNPLYYLFFSRFRFPSNTSYLNLHNMYDKIEVFSHHHHHHHFTYLHHRGE